MPWSSQLCRDQLLREAAVTAGEQVRVTVKCQHCALRVGCWAAHCAWTNSIGRGGTQVCNKPHAVSAVNEPQLKQ